MYSLAEWGYSNIFYDIDKEILYRKKNNKYKPVTYSQTKVGWVAVPDNSGSGRIIKKEALHEFLNDDYYDKSIEWKPLPKEHYPHSNYEYIVSEYGDVLRKPTVTRKSEKCGHLKKDLGYKAVSFLRRGKRHYIHRIVAHLWLGEIPEEMVVNHIDGNKLNNHYSNLEIISHEDNVKHAWNTGLITQHRRYKNFTKKQKAEIVFKSKFKVYTLTKLAEEYDCSIQKISQILNENKSTKDQEVLLIESLLNGLAV